MLLLRISFKKDPTFGERGPDVPLEMLFLVSINLIFIHNNKGEYYHNKGAENIYDRSPHCMLFHSVSDKQIIVDFPHNNVPEYHKN